MKQATTTAISPCLIVSSVERTAAFYCEKLGFETTFKQPDKEPFFAIIHRDGAQLLVKSHDGIKPVPNSGRHPFLRWDAFMHPIRMPLLLNLPIGAQLSALH